MGYQWAGNGRILISVGWTTPRRGDEVYVTRLFVYDLAENRMQLIGKKDGGLEGDDVLYVDPRGKLAAAGLSEVPVRIPRRVSS